jgi:hypothetical protein
VFNPTRLVLKICDRSTAALSLPDTQPVPLLSNSVLADGSQALILRYSRSGRTLHGRTFAVRSRVGAVRNAARGSGSDASPSRRAVVNP